MKFAWTYLALMPTAAFAGLTVYDKSPNQDIPDGNTTGLQSVIDVSGLPNSVVSVTVTLDILGGSNGDLYAYLANADGGFAVLLNRPGKTSGDPFGYDDAGLKLTLDDSAANNVHNYQSVSYSLNTDGQLTGLWKPDGRSVDPQKVVDTDAPSTALGDFNVHNPNGAWTLFVADLSGGNGSGKLVSWGLNITTSTPVVPEPRFQMTILGALLLAGASARHLAKANRRP
jgi:subtilisin-like proprotein convertase family protein